LRTTQFGFRQGHSTAEPLFIIRRLQDLVVGRKNQALHMIFLDWEKAFDRIDTRALGTVLQRYGVPLKMRSMVLALVGDPEFRVAMAGRMSAVGRQETGIRQGCTLSPFLFTLVLSAIMHDAVGRVRQAHPFAVTPIMPVLDMEYADDTVLIARTAEVAKRLLWETELEAGKYGMALNRAKVKRIAYGSEEEIAHADGQAVKRVEKAEYLGAIIHEDGDPGPEIKHRIARTKEICNALRPLWKAQGLAPRDAVRVVSQCAPSSLTYALPTMFYHKAWAGRIDATQVGCYRKALRIPTTHAAILMGQEPVKNVEVMEKAGAQSLSKGLLRSRFILLGHVLRRDGGDPMRATAYDRFGAPRELRATRKPGDQKLKWNKEMMKLAEQALKELGWIELLSAGRGTPSVRIAQLAQDREAWKKWINLWARRATPAP